MTKTIGEVVLIVIAILMVVWIIRLAITGSIWPFCWFKKEKK